MSLGGIKRLPRFSSIVSGRAGFNLNFLPENLTLCPCKLPGLLAFQWPPNFLPSSSIFVLIKDHNIITTLQSAACHVSMQSLQWLSLSQLCTNSLSCLQDRPVQSHNCLSNNHCIVIVLLQSYLSSNSYFTGQVSREEFSHLYIVLGCVLRETISASEFSMQKV